MKWEAFCRIWRSMSRWLGFIFLLVLPVVVCAQPRDSVAYAPGRFIPDTADLRNFTDPTALERHNRLYDSLELKAGRHKLSRMLYKFLVVTSSRDTMGAAEVVDESAVLKIYDGRRIGSVEIERHTVFDSPSNFLERSANALHAVTRERVIRRDLLFGAGDSFDAQTIVRNMQLLRSRPYISDVGVTVAPDPQDPSRVVVRVITWDSWTLSLEAAWRSDSRTMVGLSDANIAGTGTLLRIKTNFHRRDFSYGGNEVEYEMPNIFGSFFSANAGGGRDFYNSRFNIGVRKEFLLPTDYEAGASYSNTKHKRYLIAGDTSVLVKERNFDLWGGYSHWLPSVNASLYVTGRYGSSRHLLRPEVSAALNPVFHEQDVVLAGVGVYREKFLSANMVYGFGHREYLATGFRAEVVGGYRHGEFSDDIYISARIKAGGFRPIGYLMGGVALGSYRDTRLGAWRQSLLDVDARWFSNLWSVHRSRLRQFVALNYTLGWNRLDGNDEMVRFTKNDGMQVWREYHTGTNRLVLNTETILFTPLQPLGFRIALFGFVDAGLLGYDANIFRNSFYSTVGLGIRLRNERLIFSTIQLRLGMAFTKHGLAECDYFRLGNYTSVEQLRYRPTCPEIVPFK